MERGFFLRPEWLQCFRVLYDAGKNVQGNALVTGFLFLEMAANYVKTRKLPEKRDDNDLAYAMFGLAKPLIDADIKALKEAKLIR